MEVSLLSSFRALALFIEDPKIAIARFLLIVLGFILAGWDSAGSLNR